MDLEPGSNLHFGPFSLDGADGDLWRGSERCKLTAKAEAVLRYLVAHPGRLVRKADLLAAIWPDTYVSDWALTTCIREIRQALGDVAKTPQYIATVYRQGYRFIAPVRQAGLASVCTKTSEAHHSLQIASTVPPVHFVGREAELAQMHQWLREALQGKRQIGVIAGETGIGKTALVNAFVSHVITTEDLWVGQGQCINHYGVGEPYLPVLDALGRLCRGPKGEHFLAILRQHAPSWLAAIPAALRAFERASIPFAARADTQVRMLRELAETIEVLSMECPLLLVFEDVHWSDTSTLDWLAFVAQRRDPAHLCILITYRPVDAWVNAHPVRAVLAELRQRRQCVELSLDYLSQSAIAVYLFQRFGRPLLSEALTQMLHQHTSGNPLFLTAVVDDLVSQGVLAEMSEGWCIQGNVETLTSMVPASLQLLIEQHVEQLSPEDQALLEAASIAGPVFSIAAVSAGLARPESEVEARCAAWVRQGRFILERGMEVWPDRTVTAYYSFIHALYHEVVYRRVSAGRRVQLHRQIGLRKEAGYGDQALELAVELAEHFACGCDPRRAVHYLRHAGMNALRLSSYKESVNYLIRGLELLATLPDTPERTQQEFDLQMALGLALMATEGHTSTNVEQLYSRAWILCQHMDESPELFSVLWGLWQYYCSRATLQSAWEIGNQFLTLAQRTNNPAHLLAAHASLGCTLWYRGEFAAARPHLQPGITLSDSEEQRDRAFRYGISPEVRCLSYGAANLWLLGYPEQGLQMSRAALELAQELTHPPSLVFALYWVACLHQFRREVYTTQEMLKASLTLATEAGLILWVANGACLNGWVLAMLEQEEEGIAQMRQGLTDISKKGLVGAQPGYLSLLAEINGRIGKVDEGLCILAEALSLVNENGQRHMEAELYRLKGELLLAQSLDNIEEATICLHSALSGARHQHAKSWELRAATSLAKLWQSQGQRQEAYDLLAPVYGWFTEGFDTADLKDAKALLDALA